MHRLPVAFLALLLLCGAAHAENIRAVRPLVGHACMRLALTPEQDADPGQGVPVHDAPSRSARVVGWAPSVVVVPAPQQPNAGFLQVLFPDGRPGWVQAGYLKPWSNPYAPGRRCIPSVMSDGGIGYDFRQQ